MGFQCDTLGRDGPGEKDFRSASLFGLEPRFLSSSDPTFYPPRLHTRAATDHAAEVHSPDGQAFIGIARILDLSTTGACLESTAEWNEGDGICLRLLLEGRTALTLPGKIVWKRYFTRTYQFGVRFAPLLDESKNKIQAFVDSYAVRLRRLGPKPFHPDAME